MRTTQLPQFSLLAGAALACVALAQQPLLAGESGPPQVGQDPEPETPPLLGIPLVRDDDPLPDVHEQMNRLMAEIEEGLYSTDRLLWDASAGSVAGGTPVSVAIEEARERALRAVEDMDRLLLLAEHPHEPGGS